jgi:hypothetical protein
VIPRHGGITEHEIVTIRSPDRERLGIGYEAATLVDTCQHFDANRLERRAGDPAWQSALVDHASDTITNPWQACFAAKSAA